jgi:predicted transcriptional regulator
MYKYNLSYKQLELYIKILSERKLLAKKTYENDREKVVTTTKGNSFVKDFQALQAQVLE